MKRKILLFLLWFVSCCLYSQSSDQNYVCSRTFLDSTGTRYVDKIQYYDGLGRKSELVSSGSSGYTPSGKDLVSLQEYDAYGRVSMNWLPVVSTNPSKGTFLDNFSTNAVSYYGDASPYSENIYEASPLDRVAEVYGPGAAWRTAGKFTGTDYLANIKGDALLDCRLYTTSTEGSDVTITSSGSYDTNELYVTKSTDEDGKASYTFKDKQDRLILSRAVNGSVNCDTYYIYDDYGNLTAVVPPLAADAGASLSADQKNKYCFLYIYDSRNRCIKKKLPACDWVYNVYDSSDRLIFSQDGEQRKQSVWTFNKYDALGRLIISGLYPSALTHDQLIAAYKNVSVIESPTRSGNYWYTWNFLSGLSINNILLINYYDSYSHFIDQIGEPYHSLLTYDASGDYNRLYRDDIGGYYYIQGQLAGIREKYKENGKWVEKITAYYYDDRGRVIEECASNRLGGVDKTYTQYSFTDKPVKVMKRHLPSSGSELKEEYTEGYDNADRPTYTTLSLNGGTTVLIKGDSYDELGRVSREQSTTNANLIRNYTYNIRSAEKSLSNPLYGETLYYNESADGNTPLYGGDVSATAYTYKAVGGSSAVAARYNFSYDGLSRLTEAAYSGNTNDLSTKYSYDKAGNLTYLERKATASGYIDKLTYTYSGNQVTKITDGSGSDGGFKNYTDATTEYTYDGNGSMLTDPNSGLNLHYNLYNGQIDSIKVANPSANGMLRYQYTTTGEKLSVTDGTTRTDYVGNLVYKNNTLDMILFDGGYIRNNIYYFYIRDRLGSVRAVADQNGSPVQSTEYYPYGLPALTSTGTSVQPYKYTGKELEETLGLERYDYSARRYDATTGRFISMDPMAEGDYETSPYAYCYGNPIAYIDPFGTDVWSTSDPDQIQKFLDAYYSGANTFEVNTRWQHISDNNFQAGLTMNDKGNYFYQYSSWNPDFTVHLLEFPRMRAQEDPNSHFEAITGKYSLYTQNEQKAFFNFSLTTAAGELLGPTLGALRGFLGADRISRGSRVFWSGEGALEAATKYAKETGGTTLEMTRAGQNLQKLIQTKNIPWAEAKPMWQRLSAKFAQGVKGTASFFQGKTMNPESIWLGTEKPILINKGVKIITP